MKILIVEDDPDAAVLIRHLIEKGFKDAEAATECAASFDEALVRLQQEAYSVCIIDYRLGPKDGIDLLEAMHGEGVQIPAVFLTGQGDEEVAVRAMKAGAADYLVKGKISAESLCQTLRYAVELHEKERELRDIEHRYIEMVREAPDPIVTVDLSGNLLSFNPAAEQMFHYSSEEVMGKNFASLGMVLKESFDKVLNELSLLSPEEKAPPFEWVVTDRKKNILVMEVNPRAVYREGTVAGYTFVMRDITIRKRVLSELKKTQDELEQLLAAITSILIGINADGRITHWNSMAERTLGIPRSQVLGIPFRRCASLWSLVPLQEAMKEASCSLRPVRVEDVFVIHPEGHKVFLGMTVNPLRGENGVYAGVLIFGADITQRKKAEMELQMAEQRYKTIFDHSPSAILVTDEKDRIISWNGFSELLLGMGHDELYHQAVTQVYPAEEWDKIKERDGRSGAAGTHHLEAKLFKKNREIFDIDISISILKDMDGKFMGSIGIIKDISERKRIDRLKDEFISTVSHELRTPLTVIREGIAQIHEEILGKVNPDQKEILGIILEDVDRLARIVNDLLDISKIESGRSDLARKFVLLEDIVQPVLASFQNVARGKKLSVIYGGLPEPVKLFADPGKIDQVLTNLLNNAYKFSSEGGRIEVNVKREDSEIIFSVSDEGVGIPSDDIPKLFNKFVQIKRSVGPGAQGTGLGLAISKGIIELHGGKIWVESESGRGSRFFFTIPAVNKEKAILTFVDNRLKKAQDRKSGLLFFSVRDPDGGGDPAVSLLERDAAFEKSVKKAFSKGEPDVFFGIDGECIVSVFAANEEDERFSREQVSDFLKQYVEGALRERSDTREVRVGIAVFPADGKTAQDLLSCARH